MKTLSLLCAATSTLHAADFELDLNSHLNLAAGAASTHEADLATHGHDPNDEFTLQGFELNASARYGDYLSGFVAYNTFLDEDDKIDGELEEAFLKLSDLPHGFELRAGRFLNRVGTQNSQHLHAWHFADANLTTARFLGEEGLLTNSVELSYKLPFEHDALLSVGFGDAIAHDHHEDEHGHDHEHLEGEEALLADDIITARLKGIYKRNDFNSITYGLSGAWGDNGFGESTSLYGGDLTYQWRENGIEPGGRSFRATVETIYREFDYAGEIEEEVMGMHEDVQVSGSSSEWGVHTHLGYGFNENWSADFRYDYLEGVGEPIGEAPERHRTSLAVTRNFSYNDYLAGHVRLQYNHDEIDGEESLNEDAIWLQFQLDLGKGGEVR